MELNNIHDMQDFSRMIAEEVSASMILPAIEEVEDDRIYLKNMKGKKVYWYTREKEVLATRVTGEIFELPRCSSSGTVLEYEDKLARDDLSDPLTVKRYANVIIESMREEISLAIEKLFAVADPATSDMKICRFTGAMWKQWVAEQDWTWYMLMRQDFGIAVVEHG